MLSAKKMKNKERPIDRKPTLIIIIQYSLETSAPIEQVLQPIKPITVEANCCADFSVSDLVGTPIVAAALPSESLSWESLSSKIVVGELVVVDSDGRRSKPRQSLWRLRRSHSSKSRLLRANKLEIIVRAPLCRARRVATVLFTSDFNNISTAPTA